MRVGKSGVVSCDQCGKVIVGQADVFRRGTVEHHFCKNGCLNQYILEDFNDHIGNEVEKKVREEFNLIHKQVCPACRYRLQKLL